MDSIRIKLSENIYIEVSTHVPEKGKEAETKMLFERNKLFVRWLLDCKLMDKEQLVKVFGPEDQWDKSFTA